MQALDGFIWAFGHLLFFILLFPLKYLWLEPKPMKLHGNTPVESHRLSSLGVEPCSEKEKKMTKMSLWVCMIVIFQRSTYNTINRSLLAASLINACH